MKRKLGISALVITAAGVALAAWAQTAHVNQNLRDREAWETSVYRLGKLEKADKVIAVEIKDADGHKLGTVKDLAIDLQNGRIVEVIVASGGILGVDEKFVAVPPERFSWDSAEKTLQLNMDRAQLKSAPSFKMSDWESSVHEARMMEVYQYYKATPYFGADGKLNSPTPANHLDKPETAAGINSNDEVVRHDVVGRLGEIQRASKVIGTTVRNTQNEKLGKIDNLMVDLSAGRVVEVFLTSGGFVGIGGALSAVPPQSFHAGIHADTLLLDADKKTLSRVTHFQPGEWPTVNNPQNVETVYRSYHVEPYFKVAADNTAQNVRDRSNETVTPVNQGTSQADRNTTQKIRKRILAIPGISITAQNVKVMTVDGHVTLRGPVTSEEEKRQIAEIARKAAASATEVDDELQVENISPTSSAN